MVTTNNDEYAEKINTLRNHGASVSEEERHLGPKPYILPDFNLLGYNYRMTDLQAAVGIVQLSKLDWLIDERQKWAEYYNNELKNISWLRVPRISKEYKHGWQSYVCMVDPEIIGAGETKSRLSRNKVMSFLQERGISTRPGTHAVHILGYYSKKFGIKPQDFPNAYKANEYSIAIPLHNKMTKDDFEYVATTLKEIK